MGWSFSRLGNSRFEVAVDQRLVVRWGVLQILGVHILLGDTRTARGEFWGKEDGSGSHNGGRTSISSAI